MEINTRYADAPWLRPCKTIIGGVGGIGSPLTFLLSKIGYDLTIIDDDVVEVQNIGGQIYSKEEIGEKKVVATQKFCVEYGYRIPITKPFRITSKDDITNRSLYESDNPLILVSAFDNMEARQIMLDAFKDIERPYKLLVDGRMTAETYEILFVGPNDIERYERDYMFQNSEASILPCSFRSTPHTGFGIAYQMVKGITNFVAELENQDGIRDIPFRVYSNNILFETDQISY